MNRKLFLLPISVAVFFAFGKINAQNSTKLIQDYYQKSGKLLQKNGTNDKVGVIILNEDKSQSLGAHIVDVQQTYDGLRVYNALGKVIVKGDKIISEKNDFSRNVVVAQQNKAQGRLSEDLIKQKLGLIKILEIDYSSDVYFEKNGVFVLSKELFVSDAHSSDVWHVIADASSGEILSKDNMTLSCQFDHSSDSGEKSEEIQESQNIVDQPAFFKGTIQNTAGNLLVPSNASYNIFPLPLEAPTFGNRVVVNNPWDLTASPEGWHSDGSNSYTNTRGNNVYAYSDQGNTNLPGYSPDGGSARNFNFPFADDRYADPFAYRDAAVTNLFYMNNKMHDVFYKFGFTESARNFQTNNFSNGGIGGDAVRAEAFDGSGLNNANFSSGYERVVSGQNQVLAPRMQMYLYDRTQTADDPIVRYQYNSPATIVSRPKVLTGGASFGPIFGPAVTGDLTVSVPADACTAPAAGSLTNKIAIVTSTSCEYGLKVLNAQNAGAIGVIVYRPSSDTPVSMGAGNSGAQVTIPSINIGKTEGEFMIAQLNGGTTVNATLNFDYSGFKHSSFDNGIIAHEYGHGISNRLTGQGYSCLSTANTTEQMGEGWSDYFALMLTTRPGDTSALARGVGTYPKGQPITGVGIRPAQYSPDFNVNSYTYVQTNTAVIPHGVGFIWATMLWDLTWNYIEKYGYNSDVLASTTSGNAKALQIVVDGLKLQPCSPTFIDGRDAILKADLLGNGGGDKCMIWKAFAKRGLGVNASAGSKVVANDQVEDFNVPAECNVSLATDEVKALNNKFIVFPNPTYDEFFVGNIDKSSKEVKIKVFDMSGKLVFSDARESGSKKAISTKELQKGVYMVHIQQGDKTQTEKLIVR
ncbi:Por secretion system C-terminal sorting domain [Chryseobacterium nakagawai]|uniref:T9SS C-terminal target domain-containing protein n=1 Tax=Chryseobacterium nakagawai TaxID=1241982 RepID=A0AAD0YP88_CHRNA|nr:T9SS-dependent M36 family metallopeptidase [Chryseobacterium nakagawai]AZA91478.1 T9SS C-terminal target domain-containing protein [Chryseobacterium nakagawai]VEH23070.1 Por secretion system C-terminal sorting domain [Chryseobacterium nakagawai]